VTETAELAMRHPYDVSGGEQQRAALALALLAKPRVLFLDEPTKGMDAFYKRRFAEILARLRAEGVTVVVVSHDVEFCAAYATRCALFFDGGVVTQGEPRRFFSGNSFYTTAANRMSRRILDGVVTATDLIDAVNRSFPPPHTERDKDLDGEGASGGAEGEGVEGGDASGGVEGGGVPWAFARSSYAPTAEKGGS
jgi:energy-coupling factor transport system ATP-binding protein